MNRRALRARLALLLLLGGGLAGCDLAPAAPPSSAGPSATATLVAITPTPALQGGAPTAIPIAAAASVTPLPAATTPAAQATSSAAPPTTLATPAPASLAPSATAPSEPGTTGARPSIVAPAASPSPGPASHPISVLATTDIPLPGGTSRFDYQSLDPQTGLLFIAHLGASQVLAFDTGANRLVATIPAIANAHGVLAVPSLGRVYASATGDNQVAVIDAARLQVVARVPGGEYPDGLAYDPATRHVFVSDETGSTDTVIDTATNTRSATIPLGGEAGNTQYDAGTGQMFVAVQTRNQLVALDPAANAVVRRIDLPGCDHPHGLLIDAPARRAFVACDQNARLLTVDLASGQVRDVQMVGDTPDVLALDPTWQRLYVAAESGDLAIFDVREPTPRKLAGGFFAAGAHSVAVDLATHRVFLPLANSGGQPVLRIVQYAAP